MSRSLATSHPADETLARFVSGEIDAATRHDVLAHIERCAECMASVLAANAYLREEESAVPEERGSRWWIAIAAALLIAVIAVPLVRRQRDPMHQLVSASPQTERTIEPRLSGGFTWAPYRGPERASEPTVDAPRLKLGGAAGEVIERAKGDDNTATQHAAGVAMVLVDNPEDAAARLEALARKTGDAKTWSDVAAARYAAASRFRRTALLPLALAAADEALRIDPTLPEALFNRALILERMGSSSDARNAWTRYLGVDGGSPWAAEAREHLNERPSGAPVVP